MAEVGIHIECLESESGISQWEFPIEPAFGIRAADDAHTFKLGVKEIARQHGYIASFMSLPYVEDDMNMNPSNLHINHSIWDAEGKVPLTYDPDKAHGLSNVAEHWLAGLLEHVRALTILSSPTINCMKMYARGGYHMPHRATWGIENKEAAVRVKVNGPKAAYFESRFGSSAGNPYTALAATIAAGMDGIKRKLPLRPPTKERSGIPPGTAFIPTTMEEGLQALLDDKIITESLGHEFVDLFVASKYYEMKLEAEAKAKGVEKRWQHDMNFELI